MDSDRIGILGATSLVGDRLRTQLRKTHEVCEFSRRMPPAIADRTTGNIRSWISLIPIAALPTYFGSLVECGAKKVVALSSTSVFTKAESSDLSERGAVDRVREGERRFIAWAESKGIIWVILRPTLIYGFGRDRNVTDIARFICRFGVFPIFGPGLGLRQPIHAEDVADACAKALEAPDIVNRSYNICGAETLTYRDMVIRIFEALGKPPRFINTPLWGFRWGVACARILPRFRGWSVAMAERMNSDLVFDRTAAERDLALSNRPFQLAASDLPPGWVGKV